ncbi:MAG: DHHA1 domain-containing protein, partial [Patescibacteria group bacterium]
NIIISPKEGNFSEDDIYFNKGEIEYDLIITVDCAELKQLGVIYEGNIEMFHQLPVINIDHHISNTHFAKLNHVDIMASSTTELLFPLLDELAKDSGVDLIDEYVSTLLLTGIITDTGSFQNANTTPKSFEIASELIAYGARQQEIIQYIYKTKQLSQLKIWGRVLSKIQTDERHHIVWSVVSQQDFRDTGSSEDETGDIIDELMTNAPGAEIILLIKEKKDGLISVSFRSTTAAVDCAGIAEQFGGGGHTQAAGCQLKNIALRDAEYQIINVVKESQAKRLNIIEETIINQFPTAKTESFGLANSHERSECPSPETVQKPAAMPKPPEQPKKQKPTKELSFNPKQPTPVEEPQKEETEIKPGISYKFED